MKVLKFFGIAVLVLVAAFLLVGIFVPTFEYEIRVTVNAPVEHAWTVFKNPGNMEKWMPGFKSMEALNETENGIGSTYKFVFEENGEVMEMTEEVTAIRVNELFAFNLDAEPMRAKIEVHFSGDDGKTEIIAKNQMDGKNLFWKSILWLSKPTMIKRGQETYDGLKRVIEETPVLPETTAQSDA